MGGTVFYLAVIMAAFFVVWLILFILAFVPTPSFEEILKQVEREHDERINRAINNHLALVREAIEESKERQRKLSQ